MLKTILQSMIALAALVFVGLAVGWVNPSVAPFGGSGLISVTTSGVGIGVPNPSSALDISGNVQWSGSLVAGDTPWLRLESYPAGCSSGRLLTFLGLTPTCANPSWTGLTSIPAGFADGVDNTGAGVTSISAGAGITLTPNPISGAGSVAIDSNYTQRRITGSCGSTGSIRVVNVDGTVICQTF